MRPLLYTIGHSTHSIETFIQMLASNQITALADVRTRPYSRLQPQFNREALTSRLVGANIHYVFLGRELGARTSDPHCYDNGQVQYARLAVTPLFRAGLDRVARGLASHRIALMCAEKDPITCHRMILVCRALRRECIDIAHIRADGSVESNFEAENRLVEKMRLPASDLFTTPEQSIEDAYERQAKRIAWAADPEDRDAQLPSALQG